MPHTCLHEVQVHTYLPKCPGTSAALPMCLTDTSAVLPNCLAAEVSCYRSVRKANDVMTALREQTLTQNAAVFLRLCPLHDTARSPGTASRTMQTTEHEHSEFKLNSLAYRQPVKVAE